jgi:hypothetical protein
MAPPVSRVVEISNGNRPDLWSYNDHQAGR